MPDLQALLDQIDRLDQEATKGPWDHTVEWAEIGSGSDSVIHGYGYAHCDGCDEEIEGVDARVALSPQDAEFIALARTALPQLAKALRAVLAKCASMERGVGYRVSGQHDTWDSYHEGMSDMAGYIEETITDALGADRD